MHLYVVYPLLIFYYCSSKCVFTKVSNVIEGVRFLTNDKSLKFKKAVQEMAIAMKILANKQYGNHIVQQYNNAYA